MYNEVKLNFCLTLDGEIFFPDILVNNKVIIECQGDFWHVNPRIYKEDYYHPVIDLSAMEIWEKDNNRKVIYEKKGYIVIYIWEKDWYEDI